MTIAGPRLLVLSAGFGPVFVGTATAANAGVPADKAGLAAALLNASQMTAGRGQAACPVGRQHLGPKFPKEDHLPDTPPASPWRSTPASPSPTSSSATRTSSATSPSDQRQHARLGLVTRFFTGCPP